MKKKVVSYITGAGLSVAVIVMVYLLFLFIQLPIMPISNLFNYMPDGGHSNDIQNDYYDIQAQEADVLFDFKLPPEISGVLFQSSFDKGVRIYSTTNPDEPLSILSESNWRLIDLRQHEKAETIRFHVEKGGRLFLSSKPFAGQFEYLKFFSRFTDLFSNQFVMIITGMSFLLSFIMFSIGRVNRDLTKSYYALGSSLLFYGVLFFSSGTFLNYSGYLYNKLNDTQAQLLIINNIFTILSLCFTVLLFYGIEYFILKDWKYTKRLIVINLLGFLLSLIGVPYMLTVTAFVNFLFFAIVSYHSGLVVFTFLAFVRPLGEIINVFSSRLFSLYPFSLNEITFCIVFIGFGTFFIMDYNRKQKEINEKNEELSASNEEIMAMNQELESSYMEIEKLNNDLEATVLRRTQQLRKSMHSVKTLLNNTDEGFLKFDDSLIVEPEYSRECLTIFKRAIDYHFFPALIMSENPEEIPFVTETLRAVINESSDEKREILISLLPETVNRQSKTLSLKYRLILEKALSEPSETDSVSEDLGEKRKIMVMIRDISEKIKLKDKYEKEKELFEQIVKIMANSENFIELKEDYQQFWEELSNKLQSKSSSSDFPEPFIIDEAFRSIHTFKGNFASFGFQHLVEHLHQLESRLRDKKDKAAEILLCVIENGEEAKWLETQMQQIYEYISPQILERQLDLNKKRKTLVKIKDLLSGKPSQADLKEAQNLLDEMEKMRFEDIFEPTKNLVLSTVRRLNVNLKTVEVSGTNVYIDKYKLKPLLKTWIHLFRNIIDHAIEDPETRIENGKDPGATIHVQAQRTSEQLIIDITDDGRGIDRELIIKKAQEKGIFSEKITDPSQINLEDILFHEGFSTKDIPTDISGRGVGLNAVKSAVESLKGSIQVKTQKGQGTTVSIIIPL